MKNKILIICGPTATGKTSLGLKLAKYFDGEIVSADSRQVYKGMDVGTGKGLPQNAKYQFSNIKINGNSLGYYEIDGVKVWGYDLVEPNQDFSVAEYRDLMIPVIDDIRGRGKLPIIVGGTGFYIDALVNPPETIGIPLDQDLRTELDQLSVSDLQKKLYKLDSEKLESMNNSDRYNPRRLIRAIEISSSKSRGYQITQPRGLRNCLWIGLRAGLGALMERVGGNVERRASDAFTEEINALNASSFDWESKAASATGYKEWKGFLDGEISKEEAIEKWTIRENQYQKRQLTWFKKNSKIKWFDISSEKLLKSVADHSYGWYS